jgi:hypothetical protein
MLRVIVTQRDPGFGPDETEERLLARFVADEDGILTDRDDAEDRTAVVMGIPVVDPSTGEQVLATGEPLRWAALLPTAFRSGTLEADIEEIGSVDTTDLRRVEPFQVTSAHETQLA